MAKRDFVLPTTGYLKGYELYSRFPYDKMSVLTKRERLVLRRRFEQLKTLQSVGDELGVTRERVRQIQEKAIQRLEENL